MVRAISGYRSATARALASGSQTSPRLPSPYRPPTRPPAANDNLPRPANDNRPARRLPRGMQTRIARGLAGLLGVDPKDILADGVLNVANSLPGFAREGSAQDWATWNNWSGPGGLPLYKVWESKPISGWFKETVLQDSRQTGQAIDPGAMPSVLFAGQYLSGYYLYRISPSGQFRGNEQATWGPAAAQFTPRAGVRPLGLSVDIWPQPLPWTLQPYREALLPGVELGPKPAPKPVPQVRFTPRRPPPRGTKERKTRAQRSLMAVVKALDFLTEADDLMNAFHDALPDRFKARWGRGTPKTVQEALKAQAVWRHWKHVDLDTAIFNAVWNQVEDQVYGRLGLPAGMGRRFGSNQGANEVISDHLGGQTSDLLNQAKQITQNAVSRLLGLTFT